MLYFEDFMEAIENVPDELNEKLVKIRHLDQLSESAMEPIPSVTRAFFEDCKYNRLSEYEKTLQYSELVKEYETALVHCKEKKDIVEKIHSTYKNLVRKLDSELEKFRFELEADNSGITEQIEQRINVMLGKAHSSSIHKPEKRRQRFRYQPVGHFKNPFLMRRKIVGQARRTVLKSSSGRPVHALKLDSSPTTSSSRLSKLVGLKESRRGSSNQSLDSPDILIDDHTRTSDGVGLIRRMRSSDCLHESALYDPDDIIDTKSFSSTSGLTKVGLEDEDDDDNDESAFSVIPTKTSPFFYFDHTSSNLIDKSSSGFGSSRVQRLSSVGSHGTSSDLSDSRTPCADPRNSGAPSPVSWALSGSGGSRRGRGARRRDFLLDELGATPESIVFGDTGGGTTSGSVTSATDGLFDCSTSGAFGLIPSTEAGPGALDEEDEDHKRYCICNDVSYGDMIACDSPHCPFEWFHYSCVNLSVAPKGDWYCPHCAKSYFGTKMMKKRLGRR